MALGLRSLVPAAFGAALLVGLFDADRTLGPGALSMLGAFIAYCLWRLFALFGGSAASEVERVELGLLAVLALSTGIKVTGLLAPWPEALYGVLLVGLAAAIPLPGLLALPLGAVALWGRPDWLLQLGHLVLLATAAGIVAVAERRRRRRVEVALEKLRLDAEHLAAAPEPGANPIPKGDLTRLDEVLYSFLQQVKENAKAHGAVLALRNAKGELWVRELVSDSLNIREKGVLDLQGTTFQWILSNQKPLRIGRLRDPGTRLGYYHGAVAVKSFVGVPLGDPAEGVLAVDSLREDAFSEADQNLLKVASHQVATILEQRRALDVVRREAADFKHLYEFSKRLGTCGSTPDLLDLVLATLRARIQPDFSALVLGEEDGTLRIAAVGEPAWGELRGKTFRPEEGLTGWVLASRQYLHYADREKSRRPLFGREVKAPEFPSLVLHPLEAHGESLGALCLSSRLPRAFDPPEVAFCEVLAQLAAQGLLQIRTLEQLRALAATDGLTGLANRRVFLDRLGAEMSRARRYAGPLSLLLLDVDHFKKINDTHGHPGGDEVLREVARSLKGFARETDLICRYGGEEFAALLPNTDEGGARVLAERIRAGIEALAVTWETRTIPVRASFGVTTSEGEGDTAEALVTRADQALYAAKQGGRNRVVSFSEIREYAAWK